MAARAGAWPAAVGLLLICAGAALVPSAAGQTDYLDNYYNYTELFVYARKDIWSPSQDGSITVSFVEPPPTGPVAFLVIPQRDIQFTYMGIDGDVNKGPVLCRARDNPEGFNCTAANTGLFRIRDPGPDYPPDRRSLATTFILNPDDGPPTVTYTVRETGEYVIVAESGDGFLALVKVANPYGFLAAKNYPKLWLYGGLSLVFLAVGMVWMVKSAMYWKDLLPIQHWLSGVTVLIMTEMALHYGFFEDWNKTGHSSKALFVLVLLFNAARSALYIFILLIISLGYGVVRPTLGSTMSKCQFLAVLYFLAHMVFVAGGLLLSRNSSGILRLACILPLSFVLSVGFLYLALEMSMATAYFPAWYSWILAALTDTIRKLEGRRQTTKLRMYKTLCNVLIVSLVCLFLGIIVITLFNAYRRRLSLSFQTVTYIWIEPDWLLNSISLGIFLSLLWLWRPTANNERYGLEELPDFDQPYNPDLELDSVVQHAGEDEPRATRRAGAGLDDPDVDDSTSPRSRSPSPRGGPRAKQSPTRPPSRGGTVGVAKEGAVQGQGQGSAYMTMHSLDDDEDPEDILKWVEDHVEKQH